MDESSTSPGEDRMRMADNENKKRENPTRIAQYSSRVFLCPRWTTASRRSALYVCRGLLFFLGE